MADTLATMRTRVKILCGNKAGMDDHIDDNINEAVLQLVQEVMPQETWEDYTFATTSTQSEYLYGSYTGLDTASILATIMVRNDTDDEEILRGSMREYNRLKRDTSSGASLGKPTRWTRFGNYLVLYNRIPDSTSRTIRVTMIERPTTMDSSNDFPLNEEWRKPIESLAAGLTWTHLNKIEFASLHLSQYREMMTLRQKPEEKEREAPEAQIMPVVMDF